MRRNDNSCFFIVLVGDGNEFLFFSFNDNIMIFKVLAMQMILRWQYNIVGRMDNLLMLEMYNDESDFQIFKRISYCKRRQLLANTTITYILLVILKHLDFSYYVVNSITLQHDNMIRDNHPNHYHYHCNHHFQLSYYKKLGISIPLVSSPTTNYIY